MILAEDLRFQKFTFFSAIEMGLYFIIVGYLFLLFFYFLIMRYRTSKKLYWLFFSFIFICLAAGRVFFIAYYFFIPELDMSGEVMANSLMLVYRLATFCTWCGVACMTGVLGILLFPPDTHLEQKDEKKENEPKKRIELTPKMKIVFRIILFVVPIFIGILALVLPNELIMDPDIKSKYDVDIDLIVIEIGNLSYPVGRLLLNLVFLPLLIGIIPILFAYLAVKTFGVLRKSYALNAIGFGVYFLGRLAQGVLASLDYPHYEAIMPPLLILLSLLILVIGNNYEQLK